MGFFLQKIHDVDIVRMDVEFIVDDFGEIFFYFADNIHVRYKTLVEKKRSMTMKSLFTEKLKGHVVENLGKDASKMTSFLKPVVAKNLKESGRSL